MPASRRVRVAAIVLGLLLGGAAGAVARPAAEPPVVDRTDTSDPTTSPVAPGESDPLARGHAHPPVPPDDHVLPFEEPQGGEEIDESDPGLGPIHAIGYPPEWFTSLGDLARAFDIAVIGTVEAIEPGRSNGYLIWQNVRLRVTDVLHGNVADSIIFEQTVRHAPTGRPILINDDIIVSEGHIGQLELLLFLRPDGSGREGFYAAPHSQGHYRVEDGRLAATGRGDALIRRLEGTPVAEIAATIERATGSGGPSD